MKDNLLNLNKDYNKAYDTFCYQNCLKILLELLGIKSADYYINKSISLIVHKTVDFDLELEYGIYSRSLLPKYDSKVKRIYPQDDYRTVFKENVRYVQENDPIIVGVDSFYIPYLPYYHKSHGRHTMILTGYDQVDSAVDVIDWMEPWYYIGKVPLDDFLKARDSRNQDDGGMFSGAPILNNWAKVVDKRGWDTSIQQLTRYSIQLSLKQYYYPEQSENSFMGIDALEFIRDSISVIEEQSEDKQVNYINKLHKGFFGINRRREFWRDFLCSIQSVGEYKNVNDVLQKMDEIINLGEKWIYKLIKNKLRKKNGYSNELCDGLNKIICIEKEIGNLISNL